MQNIRVINWKIKRLWWWYNINIWFIYRYKKTSPNDKFGRHNRKIVQYEDHVHRWQNIILDVLIWISMMNIITIYVKIYFEWCEKLTNATNNDPYIIEWILKNKLHIIYILVLYYDHCYILEVAKLYIIIAGHAGIMKTI